MRGVRAIVLGLGFGMLAVAALAAEPQTRSEDPGRSATEPPTPIIPPVTSPVTSQVAPQVGPPVVPQSQAAPEPATTSQTETKFETFEDGTASITLYQPDGAADCRAQGPVRFGGDLRSVVFLDPADARDCFGPERRRIETFGGSGDGPTLDMALDEECAALQARCDPLAEPLRLGKHRSRAVLRSDGWIDVLVVTKGDAALVPAPLRYTIVLHTDQAHLTVDLKAFKGMLSAMAEP